MGNKTAVIAIGNSDDKLSQSEWALFQKRLTEEVCNLSIEVHGIWYSAPDSMFQNMGICIEVNSDFISELRSILTTLASTFHQECIALTIGETELVTP